MNRIDQEIIDESVIIMATAYLVKPIQRETLRNELQKHELPRKQ